MDSEVYRFNKSFENRLDEFNTILGDAEIGSSAPQLQRIWSDYLELSVEPLGWKALWYISRKCCYELKIAFPTIVVVLVEDIEFSSLSADVTVIEVEDREESDKIPTKVNDVPLKELYVMLKQDFKGPNYDITAECLDQYRFFYNHLWWPWDDDENEKESWMNTHFLFRLTLYYDMLNGNMHCVTAKIIKNLLERGKSIHSKIDDYEETEDANSNDPKSNEDKRVIETIELLNELDSIKGQLSRWENTDLRKILDAHVRNDNKNIKPGNHLVIPECSLSEAKGYLERASKSATELKLLKRTTNTLKDALIHYIGNDNIFLAPGTQTICGNEPLAWDVTIKGLYAKKPTTIVDNRSHWCLFETLAELVVFDSLEIEVKFSRTAITVKRGITHLNSITINNTGENAINAIVVHQGASLIANNCNFINFDVAVVCMKDATLHLIDCNFQNNGACVKVEKGAKLLMENCDLTQTKNIPIQLKGTDSREKYESLEYLNGLDDINLNSVEVPKPQKAVLLV